MSVGVGCEEWGGGRAGCPQLMLTQTQGGTGLVQT